MVNNRVIRMFLNYLKTVRLKSHKLRKKDLPINKIIDTEIFCRKVTIVNMHKSNNKATINSEAFWT